MPKTLINQLSIKINIKYWFRDTNKVINHIYPDVADRRVGLTVKKVKVVPYSDNVVTKPYKRFEYDEEDDVKVKTIEGREIQRTKWKNKIEKQIRRKRELMAKKTT